MNYERRPVLDSSWGQKFAESSPTVYTPATARLIRGGNHLSLTDEDVLAQVAAGDVAAFGELYDRYAARVLGLIAKMLGRPDDAEDVLQDVFWQAWRSAPDYSESRGSPAAWLFMIARSRACDALRRHRVTCTDGACLALPAGIDPAEAMVRDELCQSVSRALGELPEKQRTAIQLAFYAGMTHTEIATIQAVPLGTVKTRIRLGMRHLRELLAAREIVSST